jgi:hypothetical protein
LSYKSKYGFTKKYSEWIATELNASLFEAASIKPAYKVMMSLAKRFRVEKNPALQSDEDPLPCYWFAAIGKPAAFCAAIFGSAFGLS